MIHLETSLKEYNAAKAKDNTLDIFKCFETTSHKISPAWDTRDYVAVNPLFGLRHQKFINGINTIKASSGLELLPKSDYFNQKFIQGHITLRDLEEALKIFYSQNLNSSEIKITVKELIDFISNNRSEISEPNFKCISDVDSLKAKAMTKFTQQQVSKWAAAYFDETQAAWKIPTHKMGFYAWWKSLVIHDPEFAKISLNSKNYLKALPDTSNAALEILTDKIKTRKDLSAENLANYFYRLLLSVNGWTSYFKKFEFEAHRSNQQVSPIKPVSVLDLMLVRMSYDVCLLDEVEDSDLDDIFVSHNALDITTIKGYIWLLALESSYRRQLETAVLSHSREVDSNKSYEAQMVFCIDVRSEVVRRHLENHCERIQTLGFAGFFGLPIAIKGLGHAESDPQCPVLLNADLEIIETSKDNSEIINAKKLHYVDNVRRTKSITTAANAGFSFVETFGLSYIYKILKASMNLGQPNLDFVNLGLSKKEKSSLHFNLSKIDLVAKTNLAFGALNNMGLTKDFSPLVFLVGHGSESSNNPYAAALDCGACAGHNGYGNARFLAVILNDINVREQLKAKNIYLPEGTYFISAWHNTTKDQLIFSEPPIDNFEHSELFEKLKQQFNEALRHSQLERSKLLFVDQDLSHDALKSRLDEKAKDWSEIRPEWGLARNASFIVGRRSLTRGLDLKGRSFLHDYDASQDPDLAKLELIMTAPMIVTNWINMQYYASTIDPVNFGTGNKVLNNVMGGIGCIQGNASDLLIGLSEQSVRLNGEYFHEPLRLQVFIEAEVAAIQKIISKHKMVEELIHNNWLVVISIDPTTMKFSMI